MSTEQPWRDKMRENLAYVVAGTPDQYISRLLQKEDVEEVDLDNHLFAEYALGREYKDKEVMEASKKILQTRLPDLEQRLPFYNVMFDIMDKGRFTLEGGVDRYILTATLVRQLTADLADTGISRGEAEFYARKLSRYVGMVPGAQFNALDDPSLPRQSRVGLIALYLHCPLKRVMTVNEERSSAAVHYDSLILRKEQPGPEQQRY